jgi:hypothetical protein
VPAGVARHVRELHRVGDDRAVDVDVAHHFREALEVRDSQSLAHLGHALQRAPDDGCLLAGARVVDEQLQQEAVDLRLGQRVGALGLDRVLRREHEERRGHGERLPADRDLALLHDLQQRRLHLRRRAVDLVREQEVAEHGPELDVEARGVRAEDAGADEVGGDEIGRELDAAERPPQHAGQRPHGQSLRQPGDALEQHVAAGEERDEQPLQHGVLPDDDPLHLVERALERGARLLEGICARRDG